VCGIAGFIAPWSEQPDPSVLERMTRSLHHRATDTWGYYVDGRCGLGVARPMDTTADGRDGPATNHDGSVRAVLNGEISNVFEIRGALAQRGHRFATGSDSEVVAHTWQEYGDQCLQQFEGRFAIAIWDERREQLFVARDRIGDQRLYYAVAGGWLIFASELVAVLLHPAVKQEMEFTSGWPYVASEAISDPDSIVLGVNRLPAGHCLTASNARVVVQSYGEPVAR